MALHVSSVHGFVSVQSTWGVGPQTPAAHFAGPLRMFLPQLAAPQMVPSAAALFVQAPFASQLSMVHGFRSAQLLPPVALQTPPAHTSPVLQALPSSQGAVLAAETQPLVASQLSVVQAFLSSQTSAAPLQVPPTHASFWVQTEPSLQALTAGTWTQPFTLSQLSSVQGFLSSHTLALPAWHLPWTQPSPSVQALPSSQAAALAPCEQPPVAEHRSAVHGLPSS